MGESVSLSLEREVRPGADSDATRSSLEQYRALALTLSRAEPPGARRVVLVTSAQSGEGKTLAVTNLAMAFSESFDQKVLLIDGDLRGPTTHHVLTAQPLPRTSSLLNYEGPNEGTLGMTLCQVNPTLFAYMWLRPPPDDSLRALVLPHLERLIGWARTEFEWTLIDSPPGLTPEANRLAQLVDGILFVVDTGRTPYEAARRAIDNVGRNRIVGVVMNRAPQTGADSALKYYKYAYSARKSKA